MSKYFDYIANCILIGIIGFAFMLLPFIVIYRVTHNHDDLSPDIRASEHRRWLEEKKLKETKENIDDMLYQLKEKYNVEV